MRLHPSWAAAVGSGALIAAALAHAAVAAPGEPPLPVVAEVSVRAEPPLQGESVQRLLALVPGEPLDRRRLREGIRALYAGGGVDRLRVLAEEGPDGLLVTVEVGATARLRRLEIDGAGPLRSLRIHEWFGVRAGSPVTVGDVEAGVARVERELERRGWLDARVDPSLDYRREDNTVTVTLAVEPGEPFRVEEVVVDGVPLADEVAERLTSAFEGERYSEKLADRAVERVERRVRREGWWEAESPGAVLEGRGEERVLRVRVDPGHRFELAVVAPEGEEQLVLEAVPDPNEVEVHPAQTEVLAAQIREALQARGRLSAQVEVELEDAREPRTVTVRAVPGPELRVAEVVFEGAASIPREELLGAVAVRPGPTAGWRGQVVTDASLEQDRLALVDLYRREGFAEVGVAPGTVEPVAADAAAVRFAVDEGRRWRIAEVRLEGVPLELAGTLQSTRGKLATAAPWDPRALDEGRRALALELADRGYPDARVEAEADLSTPGEARIELVVDPGPFVRLGEVLVAGLTSTRESVVRRQIERAGLVPGAPYSLGVVLDAQRRLYQLGIFRRVEVVTVPGQERAAVRDIVVRCEEGQQRSYLLGVGWDTENRARLTVGWSHLNLLGGAHAFNAEARLSRREQRVQLGLREHDLPWVRKPGFLSVYRTEENFESFSQLRRGLWFEIGDRRRGPLRPWFRYEYQLVDPTAENEEILSELEREEQRIKIASITPTLEWDTRDDLLLPKRGLLAALSVQYAFPAFQADVNLLKVQASVSSYHPLGRGWLAAGLRVGVIEPLDPVGEELENLEVPIGVRFFAGGQSTHRAFSTDRLGIPGQTLTEDREPVGGNALLLGNLEYAHPVRGGLLGVVFVDAGNVWAAPGTVDLGEVRWGAGLGVRLETPAGPVRLEYGFKLDREDGESGGEWHLAFGVTF